MRDARWIFAIYVVAVVIGMAFVAAHRLTANDSVLFLTPVTGIAAAAIGFTLARR